jgi:hypothetical protein
MYRWRTSGRSWKICTHSQAAAVRHGPLKVQVGIVLLFCLFGILEHFGDFSNPFALCIGSPVILYKKPEDNSVNAQARSEGSPALGSLVWQRKDKQGTTDRATWKSDVSRGRCDSGWTVRRDDQKRKGKGKKCAQRGGLTWWMICGVRLKLTLLVCEEQEKVSPVSAEFAHPQ